MKRSIAILVLALGLGSCSQEPVPDGRILFKNESQDRQYNVMKVSGPGVSTSISPGEYVIFAANTRRFSVSRKYKDYTRYYTVECPAISGSGIRVKMIDVHVNRIAGGCQTVEAYQR